MQDGFTPFGHDEEFEGGFFGADGEFYYKNQKQRPKISKDDQIYGIFNESFDSDEDSRKKNRTSGKKSAPLQPTAPKSYFNFIKSDKILHQPEANKVRVSYGKNKPAGGELAQPKDEAEDKKNKAKKSVQINEGMNTEMIFDKNKPSGLADFIMSDEEEAGVEDPIEKKMNREILKRKGKFDLKKPASKDSQELDSFGLPTMLGKRKKPAAETAAAPVKSSKEELMEAEMEEKYGKGWKMMKGLGYRVGTGLGSNEQGRVAPIKAVKKTILDGRKTTGLDESGMDKLSKMTDELLDDLKDEEMEPKQEERPKFWQKGKKDLRFLRKTKHVRAADVTVPEKEIMKPVVVQQKVVDMRGPQVLYFEDYSAMATVEQQQGKARAMASSTSQARPKFLGEMMLTIKGNVDKTRYNIQSFERKIKIEKDKVVNFEYEKSQLLEEQVKLDKSIKNIKILQSKLAQFKTQSDAFDSQQILQLFKDCFEVTPEQFVQLKLDSLFVNTVIKKVQNEVMRWKISPNNLDFYYANYIRIKDFLIKILQFKEYLKYKSYMEKSSESALTINSNYDTQLLEKYMTELFNQSWTLPVKAYIINEWTPNKDLDTPLIPLFEKWKNVLPPLVITQLYDQVILPKMQKAVDQWAPTEDPIPIHIWIHPWFPLLGQTRLEGLWKSIQLKISQLLLHWEPHDKSALAILKPWLRVFDMSSWENIITRCILPKLLYALKDFEVNPKKQNIEPIKWLLDWVDYIPRETLVNVLENYLLRKIIEVGIEWISSPQSKKEEVKGWIEGWKGMLGEKVMAIPVVQHYFRSLENSLKK